MKKYFVSFPKVATQLSLCTGLLLMSGIASATNPAPVPEPGPLGLLVLGGVVLAIARRIHRNK